MLAPDYRRPPEDPWPTPVDDCLDGYRWLLDQGVPAARIIFAGDSAGGGLVLAVMAAAKAAGLALPAGGVMISPWLDLTDCCSGSWTANQEYDFLARDLAAKLAKAYAGEHTLREVSPCSVSFDGLPPLMVEIGDCECLRDQVLAFVQSAKAAGIDIEAHLEPGMVHVFPLLHEVAEGDSPPRLAFRHMADFIERRLGPLASPRVRYKRRCKLYVSYM